MIKMLRQVYLSLKFTGSKSYWSKRYNKGGNSGIGSYGRLALFKAEVLNDFVASNGIHTVIEFGCGDGNQLKLAEYPKYIGLDVSDMAIKMCISMFKGDAGKSFFLYDQDCYQDPLRVFHGDLAMSLDVIYHLVEDEVFETYMQNLFNSSDKWVVIYSSDRNASYRGTHVRERSFTNWVKTNKPDWKLVKKVDNKYPHVPGDKDTSFADFYFYVNENSI